jgi:acyl carrier protein
MGDVGDRRALAEILAEISASAYPLDGIFHLAGYLADSAISQQSWNKFEEVFVSKVHAVRHLEELTAGIPLRYLVLFSSAAAVLPPPAQSNHAAANAFLDASAWRLRSQNRPAISIGWSAWSGLGAAAARGADARFQKLGAGSIDRENGFQILEQILDAKPTHVAVMPMNWKAYRDNFKTGEWPRFLDLIPVEGDSVPAIVQKGRSTEIEWNRLPATERRNRIRTEVQNLVRHVMNLSAADALDDRQPLSDIGLDSLTTLELSRSLSVLTGLTVNAADLFRYPSISVLVGWLDEQLGTTQKIVESPAASQSQAEPLLAESAAHLEDLDSVQVENLLTEEFQKLEQLLGPIDV